MYLLLLTYNSRSHIHSTHRQIILVLKTYSAHSVKDRILPDFTLMRQNPDKYHDVPASLLDVLPIIFS